MSAAAEQCVLTSSLIIGMLHYSFTISFGFPHLVGLFVVLLGVVFFLVRYKVRQL